MFEAKSVKNLNDLELLAFEYINRESEKACEMTIRELAQEIHTSTTTIVRMASKLGFGGWAELKYYLKSREVQPSLVDNSYENMIALDMFWKQLSEKDFQEKLEKVIEKISSSRLIVFLGLGTSYALAQYGERYFSNLGIPAYSFSDIYRPVIKNEFEDALVIVLSVSGETYQVVKKAIEIQRAGAFLVTITNNESSTLSKLATLNFSYHMLNAYGCSDKHVKLTTQLPALALLEMLAYESSQKAGREIIV